MSKERKGRRRRRRRVAANKNAEEEKRDERREGERCIFMCEIYMCACVCERGRKKGAFLEIVISFASKGGREKTLLDRWPRPVFAFPFSKTDFLPKEIRKSFFSPSPFLLPAPFLSVLLASLNPFVGPFQGYRDPTNRYPCALEKGTGCLHKHWQAHYPP